MDAIADRLADVLENIAAVRMHLATWVASGFTRMWL
jgi:hypothetical protein